LYTSQGYGTITNPFTRELVTNNQPDSLDSYDTPHSVVTLRRNGSFIRRAEQISSFQIWLVAETPSGHLYLAHFPPFSLVYVAEFTLTGSIQQNLPDDTRPTRPFEVKPHRYGVNGITRMARSLDGIRPTIHPSDGKGKYRPPNLEGTTTGKNANDRDWNWLKLNGLEGSPKPRS